MITIKDIAEKTGVSRGTVDRVLHDRGRVDPEVERRVKAVAEKYGYRSNPFAKALVRGSKSFLIGVVINSKGNIFFDDLIRGLQEGTEKYRQQGVDVLIKEIRGFNEDEYLHAIDEVMAKEPSALAINPISTPAIQERLTQIAKSGTPVCTVNSDMSFRGKFAFVGCNYTNSGRVCADMASLIMSENSTACVMTGSLMLKGHMKRVDAFIDALGKNRPDIHVAGVYENNDDDKVSRIITRKMIHEYEPDLIYFSAAGSEGGMQAVTEMNAKAKVIVVDDIPQNHHFLKEGKIQAIITQQPYQQGANTIEILSEYILNGTKPLHVHNYTENRVMLPHSISYPGRA
ncbi:MAG: LacI family DNA-binding transcriptional regulator [Clostridiales Family XIII bacterium]|jgi:LacI family transcriptional regulator|nr:LacI family DNA-binding transcriptional regulator [Clostridiales Family XIII bacterium]